jgi:putative ABC transport system permease protein
VIGSRWRAPLRIAWRTAGRYPGRTALVATLVGIPVFAASFVDTLLHTARERPASVAAQDFGAADGVLTVTDKARFDRYAETGDEPHRDPAKVDLPALLPAGTRLVEYPGRRPVRFDSGDRTVTAEGTELRLDNPMTAGMATARSGVLPARAGEVALSPTLAKRLGVTVGAQVRLRGGAGTLHVVGLADSGCRRCSQAYGLPGWIGTASEAPVRQFSYLFDLPGSAVADPAFADRLAASGIDADSRDRILHPAAWSAGQQISGNDVQVLGLAILIVGLGLIEVVLLAGTSFAVTARRRVREFALVLASGGRPADARRLVLTHGAVLGLIGSVIAALLGIGAVFAGLPLWQYLAERDFDGLAVAPLDLAVAVGAGVLTSLAAAWLPARGAGRVPVLTGLSGQYGRPRGRRRKVTGAAITLVVGLAGAALAASGWHAAAASDQPGKSTAPYALGMVAGFALAVGGLALVAPSLVGLVGRLARRLPLTGRLAIRDAARHRHRTGPAVAASMVAVTGAVAVLFTVASYDRHDRDQYKPWAPLGTAALYDNGGHRTDAELLSQARVAAAELPGGTVVPVSFMYAGPDEDSVLTPEPASTAPGCAPLNLIGVSTGTDLAGLAAGPRAAEARAALAAGKAAVFGDCLVKDGQLRLAESGQHPLPLPAVQLTDRPVYEGLPVAVLPDSAIARYHLRSRITSVLITTSRPPTSTEEDRARGALDDDINMQLEHGYGAPYRLGIIALVGVAGLITLAGVLISVALSAAEGQADLATLAAIGASPRRRRELAAWQAALIGGLGAVPGLVLGAVMGRIVLLTQRGYPTVWPWLALLAVGLAVPAVGVLIAGATTRSRLPLTRRLT